MLDDPLTDETTLAASVEDLARAVRLLWEQAGDRPLG